MLSYINEFIERFKKVTRTASLETNYFEAFQNKCLGQQFFYFSLFLYSIPPYSITSHFISFHPIPSHSTTSHFIQPHPIPSQLHPTPFRCCSKGYESEADEGNIPDVFVESEGRHSDVQEHKVFRQEVQQLEQLMLRVDVRSQSIENLINND